MITLDACLDHGFLKYYRNISLDATLELRGLYRAALPPEHWKYNLRFCCPHCHNDLSEGDDVKVEDWVIDCPICRRAIAIVAMPTSEWGDGHVVALALETKADRQYRAQRAELGLAVPR